MWRGLNTVPKRPQGWSPLLSSSPSRQRPCPLPDGRGHPHAGRPAHEVAAIPSNDPLASTPFPVLTRDLSPTGPPERLNGENEAPDQRGRHFPLRRQRLATRPRWSRPLEACFAVTA